MCLFCFMSFIWWNSKEKSEQQKQENWFSIFSSFPFSLKLLIIGNGYSWLVMKENFLSSELLIVKTVLEVSFCRIFWYMFYCIYVVHFSQIQIFRRSAVLSSELSRLIQVIGAVIRPFVVLIVSKEYQDTLNAFFVFSNGNVVMLFLLE